MASAQAKIYLGGNNEPLNEMLGKCLKKNNLEVKKNKSEEVDYRLYVYDLDQDESNPQSSLLNDLDSSSNFYGKTCVVLVSSSDQEQTTRDQYRSTIGSYLNDRKNNLRLILTRDLYQLNGDNNQTFFENLLCQTTVDKKIDVTPNGSKKFYPTCLTDLCDLIVKSLFITNTAGKTFVGLTEEISDLELAYLLKKNLQKKEIELDINLTLKEKKEEGQLEEAIQTQALLNWTPKTNFSDVVAKIIDRCPPYEPEVGLQPLKIHLQKLPEKVEATLHQKEKKGLVKVVLLSLSVIVFIATIPLVIFITSLYLSSVNTNRAFNEIRNGELTKSRQHLNQARFLQEISETTFQSVVPIGNLINKDSVNSTNNFLLILGHGQSLIESIINTYTLGNQLYLGFLGKQTTDPKTLVTALRVNLVSVSEKLSQIQLLYGQIKLPFGFESQFSNSDINQNISLLKSQITLALPLLDLVEKIGTNQGLQRYLVVVQDTNELRPSGGFISTYGVLTMDQQKIIDFQIDSSLSLDRLIEGKIEPPNIVKQLLGQSNWSFHDSNLDADFKLSAKQMSWFYQRFKNINLDGVIGVNTYLLRFILEQTGPITLPDNQVVNQDNFYSLTSNSTASRGLDVITALTQTLGTKLTSGDISFASFSKAFLKSVAYHEVNLWFNSPALEIMAESSGLSGEVAQQNCHPQLISLGCRADTIYLNESNMSVNKLNYYQKRSQNLSAQITNIGQVNYTLNYDYTNSVPVPTNLGNIYKVYYQLYLPNPSGNVVISLDGQPLDPKNLVQSLFGNLTKIEISAGLTINQPHHLVISFTSPNLINLKKQYLPYTLAILKQPGTLNDNLTFKIQYPQNLVARNMTLPLKQTGPQELTFQTNQTSQENIGIIFRNQSL